MYRCIVKQLVQTIVKLITSLNKYPRNNMETSVSILLGFSWVFPSSNNNLYFSSLNSECKVSNVNIKNSWASCWWYPLNIH